MIGALKIYQKFPTVWEKIVRKPQGGFFWLTLYTRI